MWRTSAALIGAAVLAAQAPPASSALRQADGRIELQGEAAKEAPMGSLAKLVWVRLAGEAWARDGRRFHCTGYWQGHPCWNRDGHGEVDFGSALRASCNLAFLAWAEATVAEWKRAMGESAARAKLEAAFKPFLGDRLPPGDKLPELGPAWIGDGDLLRASPGAFAAWLGGPEQAGLRALCARELQDDQRAGWWIKSGTGPVVADPGATEAWAAGGDGARVFVIHLDRGHGKVEGLAAFRAMAPR